MGFHFRRLTLNMWLDGPAAADFATALEFKFSPLGRVKSHEDAVLKMNFLTGPVQSKHHPFFFKAATILEALIPVADNLIDKDIDLVVSYIGPDANNLDLSHMLIRTDDARWIDFISTEFAAAQHRTVTYLSLHAVGVRGYVKVQRAYFRKQMAERQGGAHGSKAYGRSLPQLRKNGGS